MLTTIKESWQEKETIIEKLDKKMEGEIRVGIDYEKFEEDENGMDLKDTLLTLN